MWVLGQTRFCPKSRFDSQFVNRLNQDAQIVTKHLTQRLVDLCGVRPTSPPLTKLTLDHVKRGFDI